MNAELTVGRGHCRECERPSRQTFAGWATSDGRENGVRPRAFYRQCESCRLHMLVLANVVDAEGLCRWILKNYLTGTDSSVGSTFRMRGDGGIDAEDALGFLTTEVWRIYLAWQPELSGGSFLAYASNLLPRRLATWSRDSSGEPSTRAKGRRFPKAHAASVSVSLDALAEEHDDGDDQSDSLDRTLGTAHQGAGTFEPDHSEVGAAALLRAIATGSSGRAGSDRAARVAAPRRAALSDRE